MDTEVKITPESLTWLRLNGRILEDATGAAASDMDARLMNEVHGCLACNNPAQVTYVADTDDGPRWLDLCVTHARTVCTVLLSQP